MAKGHSFPKHHNYREIPRELRAYLGQLEQALAASVETRTKLETRIKLLEQTSAKLVKKVDIR